MKYCAKCGTEIPEDQTVCPACGAKLVELPDEASAHINLMKVRVEREPANNTLRTELAELYIKHGLVGDALAEYQKVLKADPKNYAVQIRVAQILYDFEDLTKAETAFRAALHLNPKDRAPVLGLFRIYYLQNKTDEAIALGEKLVAAEPGNAEYRVMLKNLYEKKGDREKVFSELVVLEAIAPGNEQVIRDLAHYYRDRGDWEKAGQYYNKIIGLGHDEPELGSLLGMHYFDQQQYDRAMELFDGLLNRGGLSPESSAAVRIHLALIHAGKGDLAIVEKLTADLISSGKPQAAAGLYKKLAQLFFTIGQHDIKHHRTAAAVTNLEQAVLYDPANASYRELLESLKSNTAATRSRTIRLALTIAAAVVGLVVIVFIGWTVTHNRILLRLEPGAQVAVAVDEKPIPSYWIKPGVLASPVLGIGAHQVKIERPGFEPWQGMARIGLARRAVLDVIMVPIYYSMSVASLPESAVVTIDGQEVGVTPVRIDRLLAVPHSIELAVPNYARWHSTLNVDRPDSIDLGVITMKNLSGAWTGKVGVDAYTYNASFTMTVTQKDSTVKVVYFHQPVEGCIYRGELQGDIASGRFRAEGTVNYSEPGILSLSRKKMKIVIQGKLADDWSRIEGTHFADGLGDHDWWAVRRP